MTKAELIDRSKRGNELYKIPRGLFRIDAYYTYYKCPSTQNEYLHGIDPEFAPGTGTPVEGGFKASDVLDQLMGIINDPKCIGLEIAEYNPHLDTPDQRTFAMMQQLIETIAQ